ncbi:MAG: hypothetical protein GVY05_02825 [Bacteroidetes bacterium]|jgi:hypothetical protein|nr:hypothetical protein [Bacteroidota bacterium]
MQLIDNQQSQNPFDDKAIQMDLYPIGFVAFLSITFERTTSFNKSETFTPTTIYDFLEIYSLDKPPQHIS